MSNKKRAIEMYIGEGAEHGRWYTDYAFIPIDTPDNKINEEAIKAGKEEFKYKPVAFIGVYSIPSLEDNGQIMGYDEHETFTFIYSIKKDQTDQKEIEVQGNTDTEAYELFMKGVIMKPTFLVCVTTGDRLI